MTAQDLEGQTGQVLGWRDSCRGVERGWLQPRQRECIGCDALPFSLSLRIECQKFFGSAMRGPRSRRRNE